MSLLGYVLHVRCSVLIIMIIITRMHSSKMRTARSSSHPVGSPPGTPPNQDPPGPGTPQSRPPPRADPLETDPLPDQAPPPPPIARHAWIGHTPPAARHAVIPPAMHAGIAPPVNKMTNRSKNITVNNGNNSVYLQVWYFTVVQFETFSIRFSGGPRIS